LALRNVIANALKYSPPGTQVTVRMWDSDEPLALVVDVQDVGPGIQSELLPRLFARGARGAARSSGMGLGLYIVRQVMALHQGAVELVSTGAGGTTLRLSINQTVCDV
jgi:signal transduction histidine kinase